MFKNYFSTPYSFDELLKSSRSQARQDLFVVAMFEGKTNGTFLELGAGHPVHCSNCFLLESMFGWGGTSIDTGTCPNAPWETLRSNTTFLETDAITFDYDALSDYFDYLQIDIDNTVSQMEIINRLENKEFGVVTVEHDIYRNTQENIDFQKFARQAFVDRGYVLLADNVCVDTDWWAKEVVMGGGSIQTLRELKKYPGKICFEDWFVNPKYIKEELIKAYKNITLDSREKLGDDVLFVKS
jgi:hypothetical protein